MLRRGGSSTTTASGSSMSSSDEAETIQPLQPRKKQRLRGSEAAVAAVAPPRGGEAAAGAGAVAAVGLPGDELGSGGGVAVVRQHRVGELPAHPGICSEGTIQVWVSVEGGRGGREGGRPASQSGGQ